jgi:choline dehydrogenase-like flavoprotein
VTDVVVVGAGTAGSLVAAAGADVVLLEAGPDPGPAHSERWPRDMLDTARVATSHDWGYAGPAADGRVLPFARARIVGVCGAHNGCSPSIGWGPDYDRLDHPRLASAALAAAAPRLLSELAVAVPPLERLTPFQRRVLDAAKGAGHRRCDDLLALGGGAGASVSPVDVRAGVRSNAAFAFLDAQRHAVDVRGDALVDRLESNRARLAAIHAIVAGVRTRIATARVVLCAGALGTPEVLLRSGIAPADELAALGIRPVIDLPAVGRGMADHPVLAPMLPAGRELARALDALEAAGTAVADGGVVVKLASGADPEGAPYDLHLFLCSERNPTAPGGWAVALAVGLLRPRSRGRLKLRSADPPCAPTSTSASCARPAAPNG